jgi:predicted ATP-grasp superfamily ATP-dependent carboligase
MNWERESSSHKIYKIHDRQDIQKIPFELFGVAERYLVQQWIPGDDKNIHFCLVYFDKEGREIGSYTGKKILQWRVGTGNTAVCIGTENEEIRCLTREILQSAEFRGLGSVEFKWSDKDKRYYIMEPTIGRNDLQSYVAVSGGVNLTLLAFLDVFGIPNENETKPPKKSVWLEEKHLYYAVKYLRGRNEYRFSQIIADIRREGSLTCAYWDRSDPLPFLYMLGKMVRRKIKKEIMSK